MIHVESTPVYQYTSILEELRILCLKLHSTLISPKDAGRMYTVVARSSDHKLTMMQCSLLHSGIAPSVG